MYRSILLAYDGSTEGVLALREGALLAKTCGAKVVLLAVVPHVTGAAEVAEGIGGGFNDQIDAYRDLLNRAVSWMKERGFDPIPKLMIGNPVQTIGMVATEMEADLVVVGHQRQSFLTRWWSGSTNAYLSDHVGCSILIACNPVSDESIEMALPKNTLE